jgi:hypothetical protein
VGKTLYKHEMWAAVVTPEERIAGMCRWCTLSDVREGLAGGLTEQEILAADRMRSASGMRVSLYDVAHVKRSYSAPDTMVYDQRAIRAVGAGQFFTTEDVRSATPSLNRWANPSAAEPGQLWIGPWALGTTGDRVESIASDAVGRVIVHFPTGTAIGSIYWFTLAEGGRCVGYELPDGRRVMVGERWNLTCIGGRVIECTVTHVEDRGWVGMRSGIDTPHGAQVALMMNGSGLWRRVEPETYEQECARFLAGTSFAAAARADLKKLAHLHGVYFPSPRELSRQRVDRAIATYRGPFAAAVGAGLRAASERVDLTEQQIESALTMFADYEERRGGRRLPPAGVRTDAVCAAWRRAGPENGPVWEHQALAAYERARTR